MKVGYWCAAVVVLMVAASAAAQGLTPTQCINQKDNIRRTCNGVLFGSPSKPCCQLIRAANADCVCQFVVPKMVAALRGAGRTIELVRSCGRNIPPNFKCGSITTPP